MAQYLRVEFDCEFADQYLLWVKDLILSDYRTGGFDGFKPIITIGDDEDD